MKWSPVPFLAITAITAITACAAPGPQQPDDMRLPRGAFELQLGLRSLDEDTYGSVDNQLAVGFSFLTIPRNWPVELELGLQFAADDDGGSSYYDHPDVEGTNVELALGLRRVFGSPARVFRPYLGAGAAWMQAELDDNIRGVSEDDSSFGYYLRGGLLLGTIGRGYWGIDVRSMFGTDVDLGLAGNDGDYVQVGFFWGTGF